QADRIAATELPAHAVPETAGALVEHVAPPAVLHVLHEVALLPGLSLGRRVLERRRQVAQLLGQVGRDGERIEIHRPGRARRIPAAEARAFVGDEDEPRARARRRTLQGSAGRDVDGYERGRIDEDGDSGTSIV